MSILRVQVVHGLLPCTVEQGCQLTVRSVPVHPYRTVIVLYPILRHVVRVELNVDLGVGVGGVGGGAHVPVVAVRISCLGVNTGYRGATYMVKKKLIC